VDLYLRARHEHRKFWQDNQENALALFAQAEALAPGDPMILSGKALALARLAFFTGRGLEEAFTAAKQAVEVAPNLGEAYLALGSALLQKGECTLSVRALRSAVVRAPGLSDAHSAVGCVLLEVGDIDEAIVRLEAAIALDPRAPLACATLARCHGLRRSWDRVEEALERTPHSKVDITYWMIRARLLLWKRDPAGAELALSQLLACEANIPMARLLYEVVAFRRLPDSLGHRPEATSEPPGSVRRQMFLSQVDVEILAYLGDDIEPVISRVANLVERGFLDIGWMDGCPLLDAIRSDARFPPLRALVKQRADEVLEAYRAG
jgi:tetratricopeptide (TPR) repeat protein